MPEFVFRRLTRDDFPLLAHWLAEPHVARWWNHDVGADAVERDFGPTVDGEEPWHDDVALLDGVPIGFVQSGRYADDQDSLDEMASVYPVPAGAMMIDYLIGEVSMTGAGVGRRMIAAYVDRIWREHPDATCVVVPVCSANEGSWRALLAAGFELVARGELEPDNPIDDGRHEILRLDRPDEALPSS